jgi:membrane protein
VLQVGQYRRRAWSLIRCATSHWSQDEAATLGAALAFYCAFSLAPLLIIVVVVTDLIIGAESAYGQLSAQLTSLFGAATAEVLLEAMNNSENADGLLATTISIATLVVGATTVFAALEAALERIWRAQALVPSGVYGWLRARMLSFGLILAVGFLLLYYSAQIVLLGAEFTACLGGVRDDEHVARPSKPK